MGQQEIIKELRKINRWTDSEELSSRIKINRGSITRGLNCLFKQGLVLKKISKHPGINNKWLIK